MKKKSTFTPGHLSSYSDCGLGKDAGACVLTGPAEEIRDVNHYAERTEPLALAISNLSVG